MAQGQLLDLREDGIRIGRLREVPGEGAERLKQLALRGGAIGVQQRPVSMARVAADLPVGCAHADRFGRDSFDGAAGRTFMLMAEGDEHEVACVEGIRLGTSLRPGFARGRVEAVQVKVDARVELIRHERIARLRGATAEIATVGRIVHRGSRSIVGSRAPSDSRAGRHQNR